MPASLRALPRHEVPLAPIDMVGLPALRALLDDDARLPSAPDAAPDAGVELPGLTSLVDDLAAKGFGLVMVMGKGGVGKTTVAAAVAVELASRGRKVQPWSTSRSVGSIPSRRRARTSPR